MENNILSFIERIEALEEQIKKFKNHIHIDNKGNLHFNGDVTIYYDVIEFNKIKESEVK